MRRTRFDITRLGVAFNLIIALSAWSGTASAAEPIELLKGKDLALWKLKGDAAAKSNWKRGKAALADNPSELKIGDGDELVNVKGVGVDLFTQQTFGDALVELEVMVPKGSNSGVYLMGEYEVQVFDSFGKKDIGMGDMGAIYGNAVAKTNASKAPGEWQKYSISYRAPRFDAAGKKTENARIVKVVLNDQVIHENVELKGPTLGSLTGKEAATGPLMFQGDHGPVAYRNVKVTPQ